jgi:hypothetical protein
MEEPDELEQGSRLLVDALRRAAAGHAHCGLTERDFAMAFPGDGREVFATFQTFLQAIARAGRRRLRAAHPGSALLTADERLLLAVIAAAQHADEPRLDAHLCWLARAEGRRLIALAARALATAFAVHGYWLPVPAR